MFVGLMVVVYFGKDVSIVLKIVIFVNGEVNWLYDLFVQVSEVSIFIFNLLGMVVYFVSGIMVVGLNIFVWDGKDSLGIQFLDGLYIMSILVVDVDGDFIVVSVLVSGWVIGVDFQFLLLFLKVGDLLYLLSEIFVIEEFFV